MEQQHPIPQQISSYQFRLVGDMTLKQFFQIAGGALVSLLVYASGLHPIIKWPLILFFALFGVALAFLPFEERPLDRWIISFFKSVYSPTMYLWKKTDKEHVFFQNEATPPPENIVAPRGEGELKKYLETRADQTNLFGKLEETEKAFLSKVTGLFGQGQKKPQPQQQTQVQQQPQPQPKQQEPQTQKQPQQDDKGKLKVPETKPISVTHQQEKKEEKQQPKKEAQQQATEVTPTQVQQKGGQAQQAQFSVDAAPPMPPSQPNTVSGQVMDPDGKIVEGAILEIKDVGGRPVRAVKTNKLGHFLIVTPLQDGTYEIITEKEGLEFDTLKFEATGSIIPPIAIKAKKRIKLAVEEKSNGQNS